MTTNIQKRIDELEAEAVTLKTKHEETVKQFQQIVQQNQQRFAFLQGSISELKNQQNNDGNNGKTEGDPIVPIPASRPRGRPRRIPAPVVIESM